MPPGSRERHSVIKPVKTVLLLPGHVGAEMGHKVGSDWMVDIRKVGWCPRYATHYPLGIDKQRTHLRASFNWSDARLLGRRELLLPSWKPISSTGLLQLVRPSSIPARWGAVVWSPAVQKMLEHRQVSPLCVCEVSCIRVRCWGFDFGHTGTEQAASFGSTSRTLCLMLLHKRNHMRCMPAVKPPPNSREHFGTGMELPHSAWAYEMC
eukprot:1745023-Amphidinium_carterae.1